MQIKGKSAFDSNPLKGGNAAFLASLGFQVQTVLPNKEDAQALASFALNHGVRLKILVAEPSRLRLGKEKYDLIVVFYQIHPSLIMQIKEALKPQGIVFMQSYTRKQLEFSNVEASLLLKPKGLLFFFKDLKVLTYEEIIERGPKALAGIIAQKA